MGRGRPGNRAALEERLDAGKPTGALVVRGLGGVKLRVCMTPHGRGLRAAQDIPKGTRVANMHGSVHEGSCWPLGDPREVFHVRSPTVRRPGKWLLLNHSSSGELANLVNTAGVAGKNNSELVLAVASNRVTLRTTRAVRCGEELLASYGAAYTRALVKKAAPAVASGREKCALCGKHFHSLAKHRAQFGACRS